jgi:nicotinamidase-related amidase
MPYSRTFLALALIAVAVALGFAPHAARAQAVTDQWSTVVLPSPPEVKPVTLDPKTTALVVMDYNGQSCNPERRPRCTTALPQVAKLLQAARARGVFIVYTNYLQTRDFMPAVAPQPSETALLGTVADKFVRTDLEKMLKDKGITTVLATGTAANGAELMTAQQAALRGFKVVVPVDAMPGENAYVESYTVWHLTHAPTIADAITLTKVDQITYR